jgi:Flp pilus assembly protein protease CpaA
VFIAGLFTWVLWLIYGAYFSVLLLMILAAVQDYKSREVSNWITIPLFIGGVVVMCVYQDPLTIIVSLILLFIWHKGWMGGADVKVLVGLLGVWATSAFVSIFAIGIQGLITRLRGKKSAPGLVAIAVGVGLTFVWEVSIMFLN